jgi:glyoxylate reductase
VKNKPKVLLTHRLPEPAIDRLRKYFRLDVNPYDRGMTSRELLARVRDKDGLLSLLTDTIDRKVVAAGKKLRVIANYAVGFNNIDLKAATVRKIAVTNTPGVLTETTADLTFALILAAGRRIAQADRFLRAGKFRGWSPELFLGEDVYGKTLGIIGLGRIGRAVARRARGFDMTVIYYEPKRFGRNLEREAGALYQALDALLRRSDFVTIHLPLTRETKHLISHREFAMMKKTAILINTSRGPVVDERALARALKTNRIAGAGLDVYEREPLVEPELRKSPNAVLLPHIGSATRATRTKMALMAADSIIAVLVKNKRPLNIVNPQIYE